ncbi:TRAM/LAG1/CLN8 homology domain-containing protein [Strongyloides ratti]|uniref:TRAM/LAG1/CLN8 homology domain-containing protein n=1 Tax=Strongyloides ratti TaxID=34506 RepID=A0A090L7Z8_STRRB|nr:TRAM/LAG1/CLN8 homology domain-containing protein [Strongyloides ratti]CEF64213.1 TRAM/LAG1/CLN8 homology domain-containing protein [Strongyloides ratti]
MYNNVTEQKNTSGINGILQNENYQIIGMAILSILFFRFAIYVVRWYFFKSLLFRSSIYLDNSEEIRENSKYFKHLKHSKKWRISNEIVSFLHAFICSIWVFVNIIYYFKLSIDFQNLYVHSFGLMFAMIFGYTVSDTIDLFFNEWSLRIIVLLFHHALVVIASVYPILVKNYGGIIVIGFVMEFNSIFLHIRSLLNYNGCSKKNKKYKTVATLNILTFLIFRIFPNFYLIYYCLKATKVMLWFELLMLFTVIFGLFFTNIILLYRLLVADGFIKSNKPRFKDGFDIENDAESNYTSVALDEISLISQSSENNTLKENNKFLQLNDNTDLLKTNNTPSKE